MRDPDLARDFQTYWQTPQSDADHMRFRRIFNLGVVGWRTCEVINLPKFRILCDDG